MKNVLIGKYFEHLVPFGNEKRLVHPELLEPLAELAKRAIDAGFELGIASSFRSFERQLLIWNEKVRGKRPVLDENERLLDIKKLSREELLFAILKWSALPGLSRHHWGTDLDVYDLRACRERDYTLQLTRSECEDGGIFAPFHKWLDGELPALGFGRPYQGSGSVASEPWHISFKAVASRFEGKMTKKILRDVVERESILLKSEILKNLGKII